MKNAYQPDCYTLSGDRKLPWPTLPTMSQDAGQEGGQASPGPHSFPGTGQLAAAGKSEANVVNNQTVLDVHFLHIYSHSMLQASVICRYLIDTRGWID